MSLEDSRSLVGIYHQLLTTGYSQSRYAKWYQATRFFPVVLVMKCDGQLEVVGCHSVTEPPFEEAWKQQPPPKKNLKAAEAVRKPIIGKRMQQFTKRNDVECLQATPSPDVKTRSLSGRAVGEQLGLEKPPTLLRLRCIYCPDMQEVFAPLDRIWLFVKRAAGAFKPVATTVSMSSFCHVQRHISSESKRS